MQLIFSAHRCRPVRVPGVPPDICHILRLRGVSRQIQVRTTSACCSTFYIRSGPLSFVCSNFFYIDGYVCMLMRYLRIEKEQLWSCWQLSISWLICDPSDCRTNLRSAHITFLLYQLLSTIFYNTLLSISRILLLYAVNDGQFTSPDLIAGFRSIHLVIESISEWSVV